MTTVAVTTDNFESVVLGNDIVLIDFWAEWCGPCRAFGPVFESASDKHGDIVFAKIDTEAEQELAATFRIASIPTLMVFREKVLVFSQAGAVPAPALEELITKVRALDMAAVHKEIAENQAKEDEK